MRFTFNMKKIRESGMIEWSKIHECKTPYVDEVPEGPILWLVKDEGVYLMAGTKTRQLAPEGSETKCVAVYAEGFGPEEYLGGDDFVEPIPLSFVDKLQKELNITLTEESIELEGQ